MLDTRNKAIICGINFGHDEDFNYSFTELKNLCEACQLDVVCEVVQNLNTPNTRYYFGIGKINELKNLVDFHQADIVIFDDELSPATLVNIMDEIEVEVIDRTMLILRIFEKRAKTKEAKLQVEIAKLSYLLPRLVGYHKNLSRIGGSGGSTHTRGSGETALELDRRHIEERISKLKSELANLSLNRLTARKQRIKNEMKIVSFVGYTNAGKSTTINTLLSVLNEDEENKYLYAEDMLFATLETSTRRIKLNNNHEFLLTDTVGFVSRLPHHLIEAFKSTLEEIRESSLIIHLIDSSSPYLDKQIETTNLVLKELGCENIKTLYVYNKIDLIKNMVFFNPIIKADLLISNKTNEGINELIELIDNNLFDDLKTTLLLPFSKGDIYNVLKLKANILSTEYLNEGIKVEVILSKHLYSLYQEYILK